MPIENNFPAIQTASRSLQQHLFSLLQSCNTVNKLNQIHTQIIIHGLTQKNFILVNLLAFYITSKNLLHARKVFERIEKPSTNVWNQMIRGYSKSDKANKSVEVYNEMVAKTVQPDGFTYSYVINGCVKSGSLRDGEQIHGRVLTNGFDQNVFVCTNLINLYVLGTEKGDMSRARKVFDELEVRNLVSWNSLLFGYMRCGDFDNARSVFDELPKRNIVSWTTMVAGYAQNGRCKQALSLFNEMRRARIDLDQVVLVVVLSACAELGDLNLGKWVHSFVQNQPLLVSLQNALIHMYSSCGVIEEAYEVFKQMKHRSTVSWTSMITGFAKQGYAKEALSTFDMMQRSTEERPDEITFIGVLCACSHAGYVNEGRHFFKLMKDDWSIKPKIEHYCCMVDLLSRAGFIDEAYLLIQTMPMKPNDAVWGALLGGCMIYKKPELASHVAQKLAFELDTNRVAGYHVLLSNVYAAAKRWEDVAIVRRKMVEMDVKKPAARSWIQVNGRIHEFLADDLNHKHATSIYEVLRELTSESKCNDYKQNFSELPLDVNC